MDTERLTAAAVIFTVVLGVPVGLLCLICHIARSVPKKPYEVDKYRDDLFI
jgi:hypothetical protein